MYQYPDFPKITIEHRNSTMLTGIDQPSNRVMSTIPSKLKANKNQREENTTTENQIKKKNRNKEVLLGYTFNQGGL